jgi:hypothetical protein
MSTPLSRDNKLQGLDLYAPRRPARSPAGLRGAPSRTRPGGLEAAEPALSPESDQVDNEGHDADALWETDEASPTPVRERDEDLRDIDWPYEDEAADPNEFAAADAAEQPISSQPDDGDWQWPSDRAPWIASEAERRRLDLEPDIVPYPANGGAYDAFLRLLVRFGIVAIVAAVAAFGLLYVVSVEPGGQLGSKKLEAKIEAKAPDISLIPAPVPTALSKLHIEDRQGFVNEPLPLEAFVDPSTGDETLLFDGLKTGTRLSAGAAVGASAWQLPSHDLKGLYLYAPKDFAGVMDTAINLVSPSQRILDRRAIKLAWTKKAEVVPPQIEAVDLGPRKGAVIASFSVEQTAVLMKRAQDALNAGDVSSARLTFSRLADAGNADAAFALATTYDPRELAKRNAVGVAGDPARALSLYQRAVELGSAQARAALERMATK